VGEVGYFLSSEEFGPAELVRNAARAEQAGFRSALISDHYHPWIDKQGHSPFVWSVIGGIAQVSETLTLGTGVTCPIIRTHPAIIAQAAATAACMMPGRFFLGVGAGENLNEHITGQRWPEPEVRLQMLEEAVEVMRLLWEGGSQSHHGRYFNVENARVYDLPDSLPPIVMAAGGSSSAELAGSIADGLITTSPSPELVERFRSEGSRDRPVYGKISVCWAETEGEARRTAYEYWPTSALSGVNWELPLPENFEAAAKIVREEDVAKEVVCGADPGVHKAKLEEYFEAGYDRVYVHQVGPDQEGFFRFYEREVLPSLAPAREGAAV
jgi:G6PDH family F420-dependent oxidoreductase